MALVHPYPWNVCLWVWCRHSFRNIPIRGKLTIVHHPELSYRLYISINLAHCRGFYYLRRIGVGRCCIPPKRGGNIPPIGWPNSKWNYGTWMVKSVHDNANCRSSTVLAAIAIASSPLVFYIYAYPQWDRQVLRPDTEIAFGQNMRSRCPMYNRISGVHSWDLVWSSENKRRNWV